VARLVVSKPGLRVELRRHGGGPGP
jgi:hypothetical protein